MGSQVRINNLVLLQSMKIFIGMIKCYILLHVIWYSLFAKVLTMGFKYLKVKIILSE